VSLPKGWKGADILFLDCDSTLAKIEGIDELAAHANADVADLTTRAMAGDLALEDVYSARLKLISPTAEDFSWLGQRYIDAEVSGTSKMIEVLDQIGVECHILSGGLLPGILPFAAKIGVPSERVHAVPYPLGSLDPSAEAVTHPLARNGGKPEMIEKICTKPLHSRKRRMLVGDGNSDLEAAPNVGLFAGFGGVAVREKVKAGAHIFLPKASMAAVTVLAAGDLRANQIREVAPDLHLEGLEQLRDAFAAKYLAEHRRPLGRIKPKEV
jgi:phosphoserine phosphatase